MSQGAQSLHISGAKVAQDIQMDANASNALLHMKEQLSIYQTENKKLTDQLNCLVSLIKRSWTGDKHATTHLSNIVGMEAPQTSSTVQPQEGSLARPNSQVNKPYPASKTRCEHNWERMTLKLLERDYQAVEQEIREYQQRYIENRQAYMDAVLQDHQQNMLRIPLHRKTDSVPLDDLDSRFIKHTQALQRMGTSLRGGARRVQSAGARRRVRVQDRVERMDISLRDIVGDTPSSDHFAVAQGVAGEALSNIQPASILRRPQTSHLSFLSQHQTHANAYNDASRYLQNNLYAVGENEGIKKPRPVSASSLRDGDIARSRPRSGRPQSGTGGAENVISPAFLTQRNERSLKYEATRPVIVKPKSGRLARRNSTGVAGKKPPQSAKVTYKPQTDVFTASVKRIDANPSDGNRRGSREVQENGPESRGGDNNYAAAGTPSVGENSAPHYNHQQTHDDLDDDYDDDFDLAEMSKPPVSVRVKSAFTRRPGFIDEFANDEKAMHDMEADFRKTALGLQKRLGIDGNGFIAF